MPNVGCNMPVLNIDRCCISPTACITYTAVDVRAKVLEILARDPSTTLEQILDAVKQREFKKPLWRSEFRGTFAQGQPAPVSLRAWLGPEIVAREVYEEQQLDALSFDPSI